MRAPRTAFVFTGGGSRGVVQVGMLRALTARGVRPDFLVGSSVGAVNAAYFAGDASSEGVRRLEDIWLRLRRADVFPATCVRAFLSLLRRPDHMIDPMPLRRFLERHIPYRRLEEAPIPCHVIATDVLDSSAVRLSAGPVIDAVLASAAIPAYSRQSRWAAVCSSTATSRAARRSPPRSPSGRRGSSSCRPVMP